MRYICPKCNKTLSTHAGIILIGKHHKTETLFVFDKRPGHYEHNRADTVQVVPGSMWEFHCPLCHENLTSKHSQRLARLDIVKESSDEPTRILFSKVADEHATFVLGGRDIVQHGEDSGAFVLSQ